VQAQLPVVHPVLDYSNVMKQQVMGGEVSYKFNLTSLSRQEASFDPISSNAQTLGWCQTNTADSAVLTPQNCLLRGIPGEYDRASGEVDWRRTLMTNSGMQFTPFLHLRGDFASVDVDNQPGVANYIATGESELARVMPTAGLEYRYPFIDVEPWGTQTIEPIAQLILRPNEADIGKFPNEDAQSLVFDDSNLFKIDKFSGWDRAEGGGRVNAGLQYTAQLNQAGSVNFLFGQSYQIFGENSFSAGDITNTGLGSGLDKTVSDYVGRLTYQPNSVLSFSARGRLDSQSLAVERFELETRANFDRWTIQFLYGDYAAQPELGFLFRRQGILTGAALKVTQNWILLGSARYDLYAHQFNESRIGVGYTDDCFMFSVNWLTGYTYNGTLTPVPNNSFMLQLSMRTLGPDVLPAVASTF
jgi:LPS-assembly protein